MSPDARIVCLCIGCGKVLSPSLHITKSDWFDADGYYDRKYTQPVCAKCAKWWVQNIYLNEVPKLPEEGK